MVLRLVVEGHEILQSTFLLELAPQVVIFFKINGQVKV